MSTTFALAAAIAVLATLKAILELSAIRALLYLIVSFLSVSVILYLLGAPFAAALEVITYAGAIMVLFVFAIMMLNLGNASIARERAWLRPRMWIGPGLLAALLFTQFCLALLQAEPELGPVSQDTPELSPRGVGAALFSRYAVGVELASFLLLSGLVGAFYLGSQEEIESRKVTLTEPKRRLRLIPTHWPPKRLNPTEGAKGQSLD